LFGSEDVGRWGLGTEVKGRRKGERKEVSSNKRTRERERERKERTNLPNEIERVLDGLFVEIVFETSLNEVLGVVSLLQKEENERSEVTSVF